VTTLVLLAELFSAVAVWAPPPSGRKLETVILLHGKQQADAGAWMADLRQQPGFAERILIAPALPDIDADWTAPATLRALAALVDDVARKYPVDRSAVYLVGYSAGASRVLDVARHLPVKLAGIAALAGDVRRPWHVGRSGPIVTPKVLLVCMTEDNGPHTSCALNEENQRWLQKLGTKAVLRKLPGDHSLDLSRVAPLIDAWIRGRE
jgi:pimeloyl-ACP methyl ester carboxylesterase